MASNEIPTVAQRMSGASPAKGTGVTKNSIRNKLLNRPQSQSQGRGQQQANPIPYQVPGQTPKPAGTNKPLGSPQQGGYGVGSGGKVDINAGRPPLQSKFGSGKKDSAGKTYLSDDDAWLPDPLRKRLVEMPEGGWRIKRPGDVGYDPKASQIKLMEQRPGEQSLEDYGKGINWDGKFIENPFYKPWAPNPNKVGGWAQVAPPERDIHNYYSADYLPKPFTDKPYSKENPDPYWNSTREKEFQDKNNKYIKDRDAIPKTGPGSLADLEQKAAYIFKNSPNSQESRDASDAAQWAKFLLQYKGDTRYDPRPVKRKDLTLEEQNEIHKARGGKFAKGLDGTMIPVFGEESESDELKAFKQRHKDAGGKFAPAYPGGPMIPVGDDNAVSPSEKAINDKHTAGGGQFAPTPGGKMIPISGTANNEYGQSQIDLENAHRAKGGKFADNGQGRMIPVITGDGSKTGPYVPTPPEKFIDTNKTKSYAKSPMSAPVNSYNYV